MARIGKYVLLSLAVITFSMVLGTVGYHVAAETSWLDSFHMAALILTGMGPVVEMTTPTAKIFSSLYALYSGVAFLSLTAVFMTPIIHRILHVLHVEDDTES
ncbi:MAG: hypothetical protein K9G36_07875 [Crocinitomicaceae bacterium]|nr:hypothetical protein [Crocinitomicaceae bacterium]